MRPYAHHSSPRAGFGLPLPPAFNLLCTLLCLTLMAPLAGHAQSVVSGSPDITIDLGAAAVTTADEDVAVDNQLGIVVLENLGSLPTAVDVVAYGNELGGSSLLAFETTVDLGGGVIARRGDVVRWNGSTYAIAFDASAAGVPDGALTDAVSTSVDGALVLSFDTTVDLGGGLVAADEDLVRWDGASFSLVFDGSANGLDTALDVDAAQDLGGGHFLLSFDTTGSIGGVTFADEDVVRFAQGSWTLEFDGSSADSDWVAADLDGVAVPEPGTAAGLSIGAFLLLTSARSRSRRRSRPA